jgi:plasmid maintenance system antidote protein VapI
MSRTPTQRGAYVAPGQADLNMRAAVAPGRHLVVPRHFVTGTLNGRLSITCGAAPWPGHFLGTNPELWLDVQTVSELRVAQRRLGVALRRLAKPTDRKPSGCTLFGLAAPQEAS